MKKLSVSLVLALVLVSCSARIDGVLKQGGSADLTVRAALEPRMTSLIRSLKAVMGNSGSELILDGASISRSLAVSPGIASVSLANTGPAALEGNVAIRQAGDLLPPGREKRFISYGEGQTKEESRILITLDRETVPELMALLSPEAIDYLTALMAPVVLGEELPKDEYLALVTSLYGAAIAEEIRTAVIHASIDFPGSITALAGGTASGRRGNFELPLTDLLVLENPLSWEVSWRN